MTFYAETETREGITKDCAQRPVPLKPLCSASVGNEQCLGRQGGGAVFPVAHTTLADFPSASHSRPIPVSSVPKTTPMVDLRAISAAVSKPSSRRPSGLEPKDAKAKSISVLGKSQSLDILKTEVLSSAESNQFGRANLHLNSRKRKPSVPTCGARRAHPSVYTHRPAVSTIHEENLEHFDTFAIPLLSNIGRAHLPNNPPKKVGQRQTEFKVDDMETDKLRKFDEDGQILHTRPLAKTKQTSISIEASGTNEDFSNNVTPDDHRVSLVISVEDSTMLPYNRPVPTNVSKTQEKTGNTNSNLPALIQRATRLAAILDRDSRSPGSTSVPENTSVRQSWYHKKQSDSLSDMLAYFPAPCVSTPLEHPLGTPDLPSPLTGILPGWERTYKVQSSNRYKMQRKCCGLSPCSIGILTTVLILVMAATIILPLMATELKHRRDASHPGAILGQCQKSLSCLNGGMNWLHTNLCRCLCLNGFSGERCEFANTGTCSTIQISHGGNTLQNVTVGSSIPLILQMAEEDFDIPMDSLALLQVFSATNLSCTSEDALVAFNWKTTQFTRSEGSKSQWRRAPPKQLLPPTAFPGPSDNAGNVYQRSAKPFPVGSSTFTAPIIITSNGIIFAAPTATAPSSPAAATPSTMASNSTLLHFAQISVLFVLQHSMQLSVAITAQDKIQNLFEDGSDTTNGVIIAGSVMIDLANFQLKLRNGTTLGQ